MDPGFIKKQLKHHVLGYDKAKNDAIENAERLGAEAQLEGKRNADAMREKYVILRFFCYNCHKPHYWGGKQAEVGTIDYSLFCPNAKDYRAYRKIWLDQKFMDVPREDILALPGGKG